MIEMKQKMVFALVATMSGLLSGQVRADTGSYSAIQRAIASGSVDQIVMEVEEAERLMCTSECLNTVRALLDDDRYEVREVAAWWFARRPGQMKVLSAEAVANLASSTDAKKLTSAADMLGAFEHPAVVPDLMAALARSGIAGPARAHMVRALGNIGVADADPAIALAMRDASAEVRGEAVVAWAAIRFQGDARPVVPLVADTNIDVRRKAARVVGKYAEASARKALETALVSDSDAAVRRNAAWSLGRIGAIASADVLRKAMTDSSPLVRLTATVALRNLK